MHDPIIRFSLSGAPPDIPALSATLSEPAAGAVVTFDGRVRDHNDGKPVKQLEYQAYPALAVAVGTNILTEEAVRHGLLRATAVHRTGTLAIGEPAVWLGVASAHRGAAFDAARAIMERLKYELPVWKKETYADGSVDWIGPDNTPADGGNASDGTARWDAMLEDIWISAGTTSEAVSADRAGITESHGFPKSSALPGWDSRATATSGIRRISKAR